MKTITYPQSVLLAGSMLSLVCLLCGCASIGEHLFVPGASQGSKEATVAPSPNYELVSLHTRNGIHIEAQFGKALDAQGQLLLDPQHGPTILFFYAKSMCIRSTSGLFADFRKRGFNVIVPDYPGYGMSQGRPSEAGCYAAADAAYDYLQTRSDIDHDRIVASGWSLGAAVAVDLASRRPLAGLLLIGAFTNLRDVCRNTFPWIMRWTSKSLTSRCKLDSLAKIPSVACPTLLIDGSEDLIATPDMGKRLAAAARANVTQLPVAGASHFDILAIGGDDVWQRILRWTRDKLGD